MKLFVTLVLMMVTVGWFSANGQPLGIDGIGAELLDLCENDMDQCLKIYRTAKQLYTTALDLDKKFLSDSKKRFIFGDLGILDGIKALLNKVKDTVKNVWNNAKAVFQQITSGKLNFTETVKKLISKIHSDPTVSACKKALKTFAGPILGAFASNVESITELLCNSALLKIEETIG